MWTASLNKDIWDLIEFDYQHRIQRNFYTLAILVQFGTPEQRAFYSLLQEDFISPIIQVFKEEELLRYEFKKGSKWHEYAKEKGE